MRIVPRMIRTTFTLALALAIAAPALAQTSEFGILFGGSKRLVSHSDEAAGLGISDSWRFSNSVREAYYSVQLDPDTKFKIKAGQITAPVAFKVGTLRTDVQKGKVEHIDGLIDYRFSEPFGSTGIFAGVGLYRQSADVTDIRLPAEQRGRMEETNYGFSAGINGDFPATRHLGVIVEATYHWINYNYKPRYITLTGGLRYSF